MTSCISMSVFVSALLLTLPPAIAQAQGHSHPEKPDYYEKIYDATIKDKTGDAYFQEINSGWQGNLQSLKQDLNPHKNYLILHVIEPDFVYDLRSPENFRRSILSIGVTRLANSNIGVGHAFLSWRCQQPGGAVEGTTGITGELSKQFTTLMNTGYGMASFYSQFTDGHLQTPKLLDFEFDFGSAIHTLAVEVDDAVCKNTMGFVRDFVSQPNKPYQNFGPNFDPLKFQGGGCGSFAVSTVTASGLFGDLPIPEKLWRTMRTNRNLFGYGLPVPEDTIPFSVEKEGYRSISLAKLFLTSWDDPDGTGPSARQQDPELYLLFLKTLYRLNWAELKNSNSSQWNEFRDRPEFQLRKLKIQGETVPVDTNLDSQSHEVVMLTKTWMEKLKRQGFHAHFSKVGVKKVFSAVILDR